MRTEFVTGLVERLCRNVPRFSRLAVRLLRSFSTGLNSLNDIRLLIIITIWSLIIWVVSGISFLAVMMAFVTPAGTTLGSIVGLWGSFFVLGVAAMGVSIPSSPEFVGTYELACIAALFALGVERSLAESFAIVSHAIQFIPVTLIGIVYLYIHNFSLRELSERGREARHGPEAETVSASCNLEEESSHL